MVKANHVRQNPPKRPLNRMTKRMTTKVEGPRYLELINILILQDHQKIINPHNHLAPNAHDNVIVAGDGATWQKNVLHL